MKKSTLLFCVLFLVMNVAAQFSQKPLPFAYHDLEPFIDATTMEIHYSKHHLAYVKNLNAALKGTAAEKLDLIALLSQISMQTNIVRNNAGGHYNHEFFWSILTPKKDTKPSNELLKAITVKYKSIDSLKSKFNKMATTRFGSGWAWLIVNQEGKLDFCTTPNQDNPLMDNTTQKGHPILAIDLWEHAYYLKYQNKRTDYLQAIWNVIDWYEVSEKYQKAMTKYLPEEFKY